ncbi:hypothetical protein [Rickettsia endosymbiont of Ceutorhynchus obstrictus]|uniref:hypothetical protein n=1 Tax=Rickettsia endosymbiont of Ceutorhynchus obstrictus TaxID=3066249 RepID=UPI003132EFC1
MTNNNKAIIFLKALSNSASRKHRQNLITDYCHRHNFTLLKIIEHKGSFDYPILHKLIDEMMCEPVGSVTALVEDKLLNIPHSIILFSVLGTLSLTKLIKVDIYRKSSQELKLYNSDFPQNDLLSVAAFVLKYTLECYKGKNTKQEVK